MKNVLRSVAALAMLGTVLFAGCQEPATDTATPADDTLFVQPVPVDTFAAPVDTTGLGTDTTAVY